MGRWKLTINHSVCIQLNGPLTEKFVWAIIESRSWTLRQHSPFIERSNLSAPVFTCQSRGGDTTRRGDRTKDGGGGALKFARVSKQSWRLNSSERTKLRSFPWRRWGRRKSGGGDRDIIDYKRLSGSTSRREKERGTGTEAGDNRICGPRRPRSVDSPQWSSTVGQSQWRMRRRWYGHGPRTRTRTRHSASSGFVWLPLVEGRKMGNQLSGQSTIRYIRQSHSHSSVLSWPSLSGGGYVDDAAPSGLQRMNSFSRDCLG